MPQCAQVVLDMLTEGLGKNCWLDNHSWDNRIMFQLEYHPPVSLGDDFTPNSAKCEKHTGKHTQISYLTTHGGTFFDL